MAEKNKITVSAQIAQQLRQYATQTVDAVCTMLKTSPQKGLTTQQAHERLAQYHANVIKNHEITVWRILFNQIKSPFIYLLIIISGIDFALQNFTDGSMIFALVVFNTLFGFYQEYRTHRALQLLKKYIVDKIRAIRDGKEIEINSQQLVPGDIIKVYPGEIIPADIRFITTENITIDESILTGESAPVQKNTDPVTEKNLTVFTATSIGFTGTSVLSGKGVGVVFATGSSSYFGSIAMLAQKSPKLSSFAQGIAQFSKFILYLTLITITVVFIAHLLLHRDQLNIINLLIFSMALGISIIPEALPIVITFSLARGALHLAKFKVITKRLSSIEDLGSMQLLCIDKTGTITENKLQLSAIQAADEQQLLTYGVLAAGLPVDQLAKDEGFNGPLWQKLDNTSRKTIETFQVRAEHPFESHLRYSSVIVCNTERCELIVRGNVQELLPRCTQLSKDEQAKIEAWTDQEGTQGHRVLIVAKKEVPQTAQITQELETNLEYLGAISYVDPLKPTAAAALARARSLGVKVKIISGDTKEVNFAVAKQIKLISKTDEIISGEEFAQKSDLEKRELIEHCAVFAHILPDQKVEIVQLLEDKYDIGYLGDGINDAPALKIAHVSMAVDTAADVARDAADIILLHKSLRVIVDGIHEGRVVFANLVKYIKSTLAANFGHFYSLSIVSLLINFLPMLPSQLLLISLLTDFPLIAISTDTVSLQDINVPRRYDLKDIALITMILGLIVMVVDFIMFITFSKSPPQVLQTNWFITSILIELSFFYSIRSSLPFYKASRPSFIIVALSSIAASIGIGLPFTSFGQKFLHFQPPTAHDLGFIVILVIAYFIVTDLVKVLFYRVYKK